jgi:hypothetical protein
MSRPVAPHHPPQGRRGDDDVGRSREQPRMEARDDRRVVRRGDPHLEYADATSGRRDVVTSMVPTTVDAGLGWGQARQDTIRHSPTWVRRTGPEGPPNESSRHRPHAAPGKGGTWPPVEVHRDTSQRSTPPRGTSRQQEAHLAQPRVAPGTAAPLYPETGYARPAVLLVFSLWDDHPSHPLSEQPRGRGKGGVGGEGWHEAPLSNSPGHRLNWRRHGELVGLDRMEAEGTFREGYRHTSNR